MALQVRRTNVRMRVCVVVLCHSLRERKLAKQRWTNRGDSTSEAVVVQAMGGPSTIITASPLSSLSLFMNHKSLAPRLLQKRF